MISFEAPLWLLLLGLLPLIRWLHRFRLQSRIRPSTTVFLWSGFLRQSINDGSPGKPDPRWMLRALITTLLILALAKPYLDSTQQRPVEVWIDDSLSMFTLEQGQQRIQAGLQLLNSYLVEQTPPGIQLHSLGNPASVLQLDAENISNWTAKTGAWASQPRDEPHPPVLVSLSPQSRHILITDGADDSLNRWAQSAPLTHIIRVGELGQNLALSRLSLRQSLTDSADITGATRIDNLGDSAQRVRLIIEQQDNTIKTQELDIPASAYSSTSFSITTSEQGLIKARLESVNDPLSLDNSMKLELKNLQASVRYQILGDCGPQILAVVDSHPALIRVDSGAEMLINCGDPAQIATLPTLVLHRPISIHRTTQTAHWHKELLMDYLPVETSVAYSDEAPALSSDNIPILSADGRLLVLKQPDNRNIIDCYLDTSDPAFSRRAQFPLLIFGLISHLTQSNLETPPLTISRNIEASRIAPKHFSSIPVNHIAAQPIRNFIVTQLLLVTLLLLIADAALNTSMISGKQD